MARCCSAKIFCRGHYAGLKAVVDGDEHGHQCHERLAAAHVALQQTVHLLSRAHVFSYFLNDTFLCACERKGKVIEVKVVERLAYTAEYIAAIFAPVVAGVSQNVELNIEKLFELQAVAGLAHVVGRFGVVYFS